MDHCLRFDASGLIVRYPFATLCIKLGHTSVDLDQLGGHVSENVEHALHQALGF